MIRTEVNCSTGEVIEIELTEAEIAEIQAHKPPESTVAERIAELERQVTPRRLREAALGDVSFIEDIEAQITLLRSSV